MKKVCIFITLFIAGIVVVCALENSFVFDSSELSFANNLKLSLISDEFNEDYSISYSVNGIDSDLENKIISLSKKVTYLLLGDFNNTSESSEDYYKRHQEYLELRYNPTVPKDDTTYSGLDESSEEYQDDIVSGLVIPSVFLMLNELDIVYSSYGDIRVTISNDMIIAFVSLPNVSMKVENPGNVMEYNTETTDLMLYYYFKELNGEYKLYYLFAEYGDELTDYFNLIEENESNESVYISGTYSSSLSTIYDYTNANNLTDDDLTAIYNSNVDNIVILNAYYINSVVASANGFFINEGIIITTWDFLESALSNAQYITIKDNSNNIYELDGIITIDSDNNYALLKLKEKINNKVTIGSTPLIEDAVISISSKTTVGMSLSTGIVVSNLSNIQTSIPLSDSDQGSPLIDANGNVVGMNTSTSTDSSISIAITTDILKEIQDKFNNINFDTIEYKKFDELKEQYYYTDYNEELITNNIKSSIWNKYKSIGNIENSINLELVKASYADGILSLRYNNSISDYVSSMNIASNFISNLIDEGYEQTLSNDNKYIYENDKYKIIVMEEFNYLIIVMVMK